MDEILRDEAGNPQAGSYYQARPEGLVIIHDVFGLTNQIRGVAQRYAAEGPSTFAIDLFAGRTASDEALGAQLAQNLHWKYSVQYVRRAVESLVYQGMIDRVALCGFGLGGAMALAAAAEIPQVVACVTFYGIPTAQKANLLGLKCKVQGHFGLQDKQVSPDRVDALETKLTSAGIEAEIHRYHAGHYFFDEIRRQTYSSHNAEHAFRRSVAFIKRELGIPLSSV
jgi:carboxymethylenebutenolidase